MKRQFIETVIVKFGNGRNIITPLVFDINTLWEVKKKDVYYKYYDEFVRGYILIPFKNSNYYKLFGYNYKDKDLIEIFNKFEEAKMKNMKKEDYIKKYGNILKRN